MEMINERKKQVESGVLQVPGLKHNRGKSTRQRSNNNNGNTNMVKVGGIASIVIARRRGGTGDDNDNNINNSNLVCLQVSIYKRPLVNRNKIGADQSDDHDSDDPSIMQSIVSVSNDKKVVQLT